MSARIIDVALDAGVSVGTVSNVLNSPARVSSQTVLRVRQSITKLGYVRNGAARQLRAGESRTIALIVFDATNPFFTDLARGAEDAATAAGYSVLLANTSESQERERSYLDLFEEQRVRGILISPYGDVEGRLKALDRFGIPSVLVDRVSEKERFRSVSVDDIAGGTIAVEHLLGLGRRSLGFVGGPSTMPQVSDRLQGARRAVSGTPGATLTFFETDATTVLEGLKIGLKIADLRPEERPDALFAANDLVAIGLLQALVATAGISIPGEIALVGYDDIDFAPSAIVPLTSIRQPSALMGQTAVNLLLKEADHPPRTLQRIVFLPELVVRASA